MLVSHASIYQFFIALHLIGLTFGLGGASITDLTFLGELLRTGHVSKDTALRMRSFSQMVWLGIIVLSISGIGLLILGNGEEVNSPGFLAKMVVVGILVINGLFLNFYATPRITNVSFQDAYPLRSRAWWTRKLIFIFGAISFTSWYGAFFIAMFKNLVVLPLVGYMGIYVAVLGIVITIALMTERRLHTNHTPGDTMASAPAPPSSMPPTNAAYRTALSPPILPTPELPTYTQAPPPVQLPPQPVATPATPVSYTPQAPYPGAANPQPKEQYPGAVTQPQPLVPNNPNPQGVVPVTQDPNHPLPQLNPARPGRTNES